MKTIFKNILVPALGGIFIAGTVSAQNSTTSTTTIENKDGRKETMHIKIVDDRDGKVVVIDTVINGGKIEDLKNLGIDISILPEIPAVPEAPGAPAAPKAPETKCIKKIVIRDDGHGADTMIIKECGKKEDLEKELKEMGIELKEGEGRQVILVRDENITVGSEPGHEKKIKVIVKKIELQDPSESERKTQGKNLSGDNKLNVEQLNFYPNPNNGKFNLSFNLKEKGTTTVSIFNTEGKKVYNEVLNDFSGDYSKAIDLSGSPTGVYFLNVQQGKNNLVKKIVIE